MRPVLVPAAASLALLLGACGPRASTLADAPEEAHQVRVLAADHLVVDGQDFSLADAETPAPSPNAGCRAEGVAGAQAAQSVRAMLAGARHLEVHAAAQGARDGEKLVNLDGLDLGLTLISLGLAEPRRATPTDWCYRVQPPGRRLAAIDGELADTR